MSPSLLILLISTGYLAVNRGTGAALLDLFDSCDFYLLKRIRELVLDAVDYWSGDTFG